jgi:hypothetical protein
MENYMRMQSLRQVLSSQYSCEALESLLNQGKAKRYDKGILRITNSYKTANFVTEEKVDVGPDGKTVGAVKKFMIHGKKRFRKATREIMSNYAKDISTPECEIGIKPTKSTVMSFYISGNVPDQIHKFNYIDGALLISLDPDGISL